MVIVGDSEIFGPYDAVGGCVGEDDCGFECFSLFEVHEGVSHYYDYVAGLNFTSSRSVKTDDTRAAFSGDYIRVESFSVVVVDDVNSFSGYDVCRLHQFFIECNAADVA